MELKLSCFSGYSTWKQRITNWNFLQLEILLYSDVTVLNSPNIFAFWGGNKTNPD